MPGQSPELTVQSLYLQTFTDFNIVIVNDYTKNANRARNEGLKLATTPYVLFSDNNVSWNPDALEKLVNCLDENSEISFTYGSYRINKIVYCNQNWDARLFWENNLLTTMSMVRTAHHPGFDEEIQKLQNWGLAFELIRNNRIGKYIGIELFTILPINSDSRNTQTIPIATDILRNKYGKYVTTPIRVEIAKPIIANNPPEIKPIIINKPPETVVEIPVVDNITPTGIRPMLKLVIELPKYSKTSGGIIGSILLAEKLPVSPMIRIQKLVGVYPQLKNTWTVGLPDNTFPACDVCITYSDNPYLAELVALPQVKRVLIYMLSYGMAIERERKNILTENITVMCSTKKIEKAILAEGVAVHRIGFALDMKDMRNTKRNRKKYLAILFHTSLDKQYSTAVKIANLLYKEKIIDGVLSFGKDIGYNDFEHPKGLIKFYPNANRDEVRKIFNTCKCFLMPSVTEGLNRTPIESTMCGCPAILCDGAIDEIFFNNRNCFIFKPNDINGMKRKVEDIMLNFNTYSDPFRIHMKDIVKNYTWENVIANLNKLLW
jgi:hypothetical protein